MARMGRGWVAPGWAGAQAGTAAVRTQGPVIWECHFLPQAVAPWAVYVGVSRPYSMPVDLLWSGALFVKLSACGGASGGASGGGTFAVGATFVGGGAMFVEAVGGGPCARN